MIVIENAYLRARVNEVGAELNSVVHTSTGREYMWQGEASYWPSHAPILFPIIGGTKNDTYMYKGVRYHLDRHGFAARRRFTVVQVDSATAEFSLEQDDETKLSFPFDFRLTIQYSLKEDCLEIKVRVLNDSSVEQFFSFGWHPGFFLEGMNPGSRLSDYALSFSAMNEQLNLVQIRQGFRTGTINNKKVSDGQLPLNKEMFATGPVVFSNLASDSITLSSKNHPAAIDMKIGDAPYVGLWTTSKDDSPFLCIEPWYGITDSQEDQVDFSKKVGIQKNAPGAEFSRLIVVRFR